MATIGYTSAGTEQLMNYSNQVLLFPFVCPSNGTLNSFTAYITDYFAIGDGKAKFAMYSYNGAGLWTLIANTTSAEVNNPLPVSWKSANVASGASLVAGQTYYLAVWGNNPSGSTYQ